MPHICLELLFVEKDLTFKDIGVSWADIDVGAVTKGLNNTLIDYLTLEATCQHSVNKIHL
jgi:hypothetical protein